MLTLNYRRKPYEVQAWQWTGQEYNQWPEWIKTLSGPLDVITATLQDLLYVGKQGKNDLYAKKGEWVVRNPLGRTKVLTNDVFLERFTPITP